MDLVMQLVQAAALQVIESYSDSSLGFGYQPSVYPPGFDDADTILGESGYWADLELENNLDDMFDGDDVPF